MNEHADNSNFVRQLRLPSGRRIEVVYFEQPHDCNEDESTSCGSCGCSLVHPICWEGIGASHWRVTLRCPNCEWCGTTVLDQDAIDRLDAEMERGAEVLIELVRRIEFEQMLEDTERFVRALADGHILPTDF